MVVKYRLLLFHFSFFSFSRPQHQSRKRSWANARASSQASRARSVRTRARACMQTLREKLHAAALVTWSWTWRQIEEAKAIKPGSGLCVTERWLAWICERIRKRCAWMSTDIYQCWHHEILSKGLSSHFRIFTAKMSSLKQHFTIWIWCLVFFLHFYSKPMKSLFLIMGFYSWWRT